MNLFKTLCLAVTLLCIHTNGLSQASDKNGNHAVNTLLRPSISLHTGVSVPFGKFRDKSNWSRLQRYRDKDYSPKDLDFERMHLFSHQDL